MTFASRLLGVGLFSYLCGVATAAVGLPLSVALVIGWLGSAALVWGLP